MLDLARSTSERGRRSSACGLCGCTKTPSWRKNVLHGSLICNACCCFLYRRIRSGRGGVGRGASLARAVSSLANKLRAGRGGLPRSEASRATKHPSRAAQMIRPSAAQQGRGGAPPTSRQDPEQEARSEQQAQHETLAAQELEARPAPPKTAQQAQQLLADVLQHLGEAALRREQADRAEEAAARRRQQACERAWMKKAKRRAKQQAQARKAQEQRLQSKRPLHGPEDRRPAAGNKAAAGGGAGVEQLREAAWRAAADQQAAAEAMMAAWRNVYSLPGLKLPGVSPTPLGAAPAVWLLQAAAGEGSNCPLPLPVGLLLLRVHPSCPPAPGNQEQPFLRLLVHSRRDGSLLQAWESAAAMQGRFERHPRFGLPCWDSGDGWQLLFPEPQLEQHQAELFTAVLASFGPSAEPTEPSLPLTPPKLGDSPAACSPDSRLREPAAAQPPAKRQLFALGSPAQQGQRSVPHSVVLTGAAAPVPACRLPQQWPQSLCARPSAAPASPQPEQLSSSSLGSGALPPGIPETEDMVAWHSCLSSADLAPHSGPASPAGRGSPLAAAPALQDRHAGHGLAAIADFDDVDAACTGRWLPQAQGMPRGSTAAGPAEVSCLGSSGASSLPSAAGFPAGGASPAARLHADSSVGACAAVQPPPAEDVELLPFIDFDWEEELQEGLPADPICSFDALCTCGI
ncbi:hypothetical protein ABPG75_003392 [Micractinium tetrahymenae]